LLQRQQMIEDLMGYTVKFSKFANCAQILRNVTVFLTIYLFNANKRFQVVI
jgi:hypothetical protein